MANSIKNSITLPGPNKVLKTTPCKLKLILPTHCMFRLDKNMTSLFFNFITRTLHYLAGTAPSFLMNRELFEK